MPINPADAALLDAVPGEGAIEGPIATGAAALPAAASPASATPPVASMAPPATPLPVAPLPPELQGTQDAIDQGLAAAGEVGAAKAQASADLAQAAADNRVQHEMAAQEAADLRAAHASAAQRAEDQTQRALEHARDSHIPNFWAGREGARTSSTLMVALGGAAAGLLGSSKNGAAEIIQGNVDSYYRREKDKVDNLYKYAEAKGRMQDDLRLRQAADLAELQVQHGATNLAIADHITEITNASQGRVDVAEAKGLAAKIAAEGQKNILAGRKTLAEINLHNAQAQKARAVKAAGAGGGAGAPSGAIALTEAIEKGAINPDGSRRPLTQSEMQKAAAEFSVKLNGTPSQTTLASILANGAAFKKELDREADVAAKAGIPQGYGEVRDVDGKMSGYAPIRSVEKTQKDLRAFSKAIQSIEHLKADESWLSGIAKGSRWDEAVLAIAATTSAPGTDTTTKHEAGTLLNRLGAIDKEAVETKLRQLREGRGQILLQLKPVTSSGGGTKAHPQDSAAVAWANANPNDPRAKAIRAANGAP